MPSQPSTGQYPPPTVNMGQYYKVSPPLTSVTHISNPSLQQRSDPVCVPEGIKRQGDILLFSGCLVVSMGRTLFS